MVSVQHLEQLAPDRSSLQAARKLLKPSQWPMVGRDAVGSLVWGECQGSGSTPYRLSAFLPDMSYRCSCPSRKFPCKHVLALLWRHAEEPDRFAVGAPPVWVEEWLARRRPKAEQGAPGDGAATRNVAVRAPRTADEPADDPTSEEPVVTAQAAAQRERQRRTREAGVLAGLDDLDSWITDQLGRGLAGFAGVAADQCRILSRRLVDAKAPGLAGQLDELPPALFALPEADRADFLVDRLGGLHLLAAAYRRQESLPEPLRRDVRRLVGWTQRREELLADAAAPRVRGLWIVVAARTRTQKDGLRRLETWLLRADPGTTTDGKAADRKAADGASAGEPAFALLLDFLPAAASAVASPFRAGEWFAAELAFYPSAAPLRALIAERTPLDGPAVWPPAGSDLDRAVADWRGVLARQPWTTEWPLRAAGLTLVEAAAGDLFLSSGEGAPALPLALRQREALLPLLGLRELDVVGLWDGRRFDLMTAHTPLGRWTDG